VYDFLGCTHCRPSSRSPALLTLYAATLGYATAARDGAGYACTYPHWLLIQYMWPGSSYACRVRGASDNKLQSTHATVKSPLTLAHIRFKRTPIRTAAFLKAKLLHTTSTRTAAYRTVHFPGEHRGSRRWCHVSRFCLLRCVQTTTAILHLYHAPFPTLHYLRLTTHGHCRFSMNTT